MGNTVLHIPDHQLSNFLIDVRKAGWKVECPETSWLSLLLSGLLLGANEFWLSIYNNQSSIMNIIELVVACAYFSSSWQLAIVIQCGSM